MTVPRSQPRTTTVRKPGSGNTGTISNATPPKVSTEDVRDAVDDRPYRAGKYKEPVKDFHGMLGLMIASFAPMTGMSFVENAETVAIQWDKMARTNPKVKALLDKMIDGGGWGALIFSYSAIGTVALRESGVVSKIPLLKRFFAPLTSDDTPQSTDDYGNPIPVVPADPPPFERRKSA